MIKTCNYYDVLNGEDTDEEETNYEIEDKSTYIGYEYDNYNDDEQYYTEFYNGDDDKDEAAMAAQLVSFKDINEQTWLGETGASAHMTNSLVGMKNIHTNNTKVTVGSG